MEYRVCQDVNFSELRVSCRGGMAGMCWPFNITHEREVCGDWTANQDDAYVSFYVALNSVIFSAGASATPVGEPELRISESGALKAAGIDEKSVGDSILGIFKAMWKSFKKATSANQQMIWD